MSGTVNFDKPSFSHPVNDFRTPSEEGNLKARYERALSNSSDNCGTNFMSTTRLTVDQMQALYVTLRDVFTDLCLNEHRNRIIGVLLNTPPDQWEVLMKQVCFIMPIGSRAHDVMWATDILASIADPSFRKKLVHTANGLFTYNASTCERGYILNALSKLSLDALDRLYRADEEERTEFVNRCLPSPDFRDGFKVVAVLDPIQKTSWKVNEMDDGSLIKLSDPILSYTYTTL